MEWSWIHDCGGDPECEQNGICAIFNKLAKDDTLLKSQIKNRGKGERIAFQHVCLRRGGLLVGKDENGNEVKRLPRNGDGKNYDKQLNTSEFLMLCGKSTGDYHKNMSAELMVKLFSNRIIPSFASAYPNHKLILFCDRAPYHCARSGFPNIYSSRKDEIVEFIKKYGIERVKIIRYIDESEKEFNFKITHCKTRAPKGPYKEELFMFLWRWCEKYKRDVLVPDVSKIMAQHGHHMLYNTANNPDYMPPEMFNNHVKYNVKKEVSPTRTIEDLYTDILDGMYGSDKREGVTPERMELYWNHCEELIRQDMIRFDIGNDLNTLWTPNCGYSALEQEITTPMSPALVQKLEERFKVIID